MKHFSLFLITVFLTCFAFSCSKTDTTTTTNNNNGNNYNNYGTTGKIIFDNLTQINGNGGYPSAALSVQLFVDSNNLSNAIIEDGFLMITTSDKCNYSGVMGYGLPLKGGYHTYTLVDNNNKYMTGSFSITNGYCTIISFQNYQLSKVNYGTNNGSVTFYANDVSITATSFYVDNNYDGGISYFTNVGFMDCGVNTSGGCVSVALSPGTHTWKAIETSTGIHWAGNISITANLCTELCISH